MSAKLYCKNIARITIPVRCCFLLSSKINETILPRWIIATAIFQLGSAELAEYNTYAFVKTVYSTT